MTANILYTATLHQQRGTYSDPGFFILPSFVDFTTPDHRAGSFAWLFNARGQARLRKAQRVARDASFVLGREFPDAALSALTFNVGHRADTAPRTDDSTLTAEQRWNLALSSYNEGLALAASDPRAAFAKFVQATKYSQQFAPAWARLAELCLTPGLYDIKSAIRYAETAYKIASALKRKSFVADAAATLGTVYIAAGRFTEAHPKLDEAISVFIELNNQAAAVMVQAQKLRAFIAQGRFRETEELAPKVIRGLRQLRPIPRDILAVVLSYSASACLELARFSDVHERCEEAIAIWTALNDELGIAHLENTNGLAFSAQKQYANAQRCFDRALAIFDRRGDQAGIAMINFNVGLMRLNQRDWPDAIKRFEVVLPLCEALNLPLRLASAHSYLGIAYYNRNASGDRALARGHFAEAARIYERASEIGAAREMKTWIEAIDRGSTIEDKDLEAIGQWIRPSD